MRKHLTWSRPQIQRIEWGELSRNSIDLLAWENVERSASFSNGSLDLHFQLLEDCGEKRSNMPEKDSAKWKSNRIKATERTKKRPNVYLIDFRTDVALWKGANRGKAEFPFVGMRIIWRIEFVHINYMHRNKYVNGVFVMKKVLLSV